MIKTTIMLSEGLHQKIKEYGFKNKLSLGEVVRQAIEKSLGPIPEESQKPTKPPAKLSIDVPDKALISNRGELDIDNYL